MATIVLFVGVLLASFFIALAIKIQHRKLRVLSAMASLVILVLFFFLASIRFIGPSEVGIVVKNMFGGRLTNGRLIATNGEMGTQARVLRSGWHFLYWPIIFDVKTVPLVEIKADEVGLIEASDGQPLPEGQLFAAEWPRETFQQMLDAEFFLTTGNGRKGKQVSVLTPGKYPLNTDLYKVRMVPQTEVVAGEVAVLKANFGTAPSDIVHHVAAGAADKPTSAEDALKLAKSGEMGVLAVPLPPGKYPLNTEAFTVTEIWTTQMIAQFTALNTGTAGGGGGGRSFEQIAQTNASDGSKMRHDASLEEREITVRTSDGFTFPVDVRIEYAVEPRDAPIVVAKLGDDEGERFRNALNSAVRAIFRNNAEKVRALDYVQQRSLQESQSLSMLKDQMARFGITVTAVRIGNVGDEQTLGLLLKTQTDREIAKQEQLTFQEQQKAAQQKKELSRTTQEAEEEKRLATAAYAVKIAEEDKKKAVIAANADAESIRIKADAQSQAYRMIAAQIGQSNAALIEVLKVVGEKQIQITPRVMVMGDRRADARTDGVAGSGGLAGGASEVTALIGTMLDQMISRGDSADAAKPAPNSTSPSSPGSSSSPRE